MELYARQVIAERSQSSRPLTLQPPPIYTMWRPSGCRAGRRRGFFVIAAQLKCADVTAHQAHVMFHDALGRRAMSDHSIHIYPWAFQAVRRGRRHACVAADVLADRRNGPRARRGAEEDTR
jgi:hypothetical protein